MDEKIVKYYEYLKSKGLDVPPTVEQFQSTLQDKASSDKYYAYLQNKKASMPNLDIAPDANSFYNTLKKKEEQAPQAQPQSQQGQEQPQSGMASPSAAPLSVSRYGGQGRYAGGLTAENIDQFTFALDQQRQSIQQGQQAYDDLRVINQEDIAPRQDVLTVPKQVAVQKEPKKTLVVPTGTVYDLPLDEYSIKYFENKANQIEQQRIENEKQKALTASNLLISQDPIFNQDLQTINKALIDMEEEEALPILNDKFSKYGFTFVRSGIGDEITVRTSEGKNSVVINFDPFTGITEASEAERLRSFIKSYAQSPDVKKDEDFMASAIRAKQIRNKGRDNGDGTVSTVIFTSFEEDGKFKVIPTLFPKDPNNYTTKKDSWMELGFEDALSTARQRGEIFEFKTKEEAERFAEGEWKDINKADIEADNFYKSRGLNYSNIKQAKEEYLKLRDKMDFIEEQLAFERGDEYITDESLRKKYALLMDGDFLTEDVKAQYENLKKQEEQLRGVLFDSDVMTAMEDFDAYAGKKRDESASEAAKLNREATVAFDALDNASLQTLGVSINDLTAFVPKTSEQKQYADALLKKYAEVQITKGMAADKYYLSKTYLDAAIDKEVNYEFIENYDGFINSFKSGLANGSGVNQILLAAIGKKDVENPEDLAEIAAIVAESQKEMAQLSGYKSRVLNRWQNAVGADEAMAVVLNDPAEWMLTLASYSISQMLPYGSWIVPSSVATGAAIGAGYGAATGSLAAGVGAIPGAATGAAIGATKGFQAGMALTGFATEYGNAILQAATEKGYDLTNPQDVEAALRDASVWKEGGRRGTLRGIPIAVVDYLSAGLAGNVMRVGKTAPLATRAAAYVGERVVFDTLAEMTGEALAQVSEGRDNISWAEIVEEGAGGMGSNTSNLAFKSAMSVRKNKNISIANDLTDVRNIATERSSDARISKWANNMQALGQIDEDVNQRIQENISLRNEAKQLLNIGISGKIANRLTGNVDAVTTRVMELLAAKKELSLSASRREVYRDKIASINNEIATISETRTIPTEKDMVNLDAILGYKRSDVSEYMIDGRRYTKEEFTRRITGMSKERLKKSKVQVKGDNELIAMIQNEVGKQINTTQQDAVQEQTASEVSLQPEAGVSEEVAQRESQAESEVVTEEVEQEKVSVLDSPETISRSILSLNPEEKSTVTFLREDGTEIGIDGNETEVADAYDIAVKTNENERTNAQRSVIQAVETLLADEIQADQLDTILTTSQLSTTVSDLEAVEARRQEALSNIISEESTEENRRPNGSIGTQGFDPTQMKDLIKFLNKKLNLSIDEQLFEGDKIKPLIDFIKGNKNLVEKIKQYVKTDPIEVSRMPDGSLHFRDGNHRANLLNLIGSNTLPTIEFGQRNKIDEINAEYDAELGAISQSDQDTRFRLDAQKEGKADEKIVKTMKAMPTEEKQFVEPSGLYDEVTVDAIGESKSSTKEQDSADLVKALGLKSIDELNKRIEDFNGMPVILGMSDILGSGTYTDSMGNPMKVNGGILFGAFGGNTDLAWAGVQRNGAENQMNEAIALYNKNKELFDRLWEEGKLPMGHVPMVIMRMGDTAVNSNEAAFRWLAPYVASLPTKNRKDALNSLKDVLSKKVDNDSAASWLVDFNSSVTSGEFSTKEEIVEALEEMLASEETQSIEKKRKSVETVLNAVKKKKTTDEAVEYLENKTERILSYIVLNHIKNNKITTLDGLLNSVVEESNKRAKGDNAAMSLPVRSFVFSLVYSKGSPKTPSLAPIKALMNGVKNFKSEYFTTDFLYNAIGEPSMLKAKQGDTVAVVGIDVLNPEVKATNHPNYGFGPKGRLIATISNPTQGVEVFPEFKAKASRIFKKTAGKKASYPDPEKVAAQVGGAFFVDKAFRGARIMKGQIDDLNLLIGKLRFAFPNVSVATTQEEFDEILKDETVRKRVKEGKVIYGVTKGGKIYINPSERSLATPIHEFGHIWIDYLRSDASGKKGTELLKKGLSLVEGTKEHKEAIKKYGDTELAKEEALVELMATKGSTIINSAKKAGFLSWMNATFKFIKETFVANSKSVTYDQIKTLSIDEFINIGLADLFKGSEVSAKFSASQAEQASKARLSAGNNVNSIASIIERGRASGISDKAIAISLTRRGFTADEIDAAFKGATTTLSRSTLSEETLPGYDALMAIVREEAKSAIEKGRTETNEALDSLIEIIKSEDIYINATNVQQEQLIRAVRRAFKKREKSAPSAYTIVTGISNIKKITIAEADLIKKQLMDYERGAKNALKAWTAKGKALSNEMRELASKKKITLIQAAVVMKKFSRVNMFDEDSVDDFITYMKKVFSDAEYADRISKLSSLIPKAKNNIDKKIGIARNLQAPLRRMLAINPSFVPDDVLSTYENVVKMFAQSGAVITPAERSSVIDDVNKVLLSVDEKSNKITEMSMILDEFENKVFDENGVLNYSETTKAMLKDDLITVEDYEFMRDNKRSINKTIKDANKVVSQADQDAKAAKQQEEKKALIDSIKRSSIVLSDMFSEDEKKLGKDLAELIKTDAIESLTNSELNNLYKLIQTINNGYMPSYAYRVKSKLSSIINAAPVTQAISKSGIAVISKAVAGAKSLFSKKRDTVLQAIRRGTLLDIDKTLGNFMSRPIFDNIFRKSTQAQAKLKAGTNSIRQRMDDAAEAVLKSLNNNGNAFVESSFKMYAYMIQLEYESNKGSKSVNPASKFIDATVAAIKKGKTKFSKKDTAILEKIKKEYSTNGEIDIKKLYDSFNSAEKKAIRVAQAIDKSIVDKAEFTAVVIRGEKFTAINNHIHLNTIKEDNKSDIASASQVVTDYQNSTRPSSKSMSLVSRTGEVSPLNFDFYAAVKKGSTSVLVDYYMTPAIREAKQTIKQVEKNLEEKQDGITEDEQKVINAISMAYDEATENLLLNSFVDDSITAKAINILSKNGYRAALAGIPRATAELASNLAYATIVDLNAMATAYKYRDIIMSSAGLDVMLNSDSFQSNRVYSGQTLSGKLIDSNLLSQVAGMSDTRAKADVVNRMQQIYNMTAKKYVNSVEFIADTLISTPDKMIIRPIWFGSFANEFKKVTGSNVDFEKIASNDKAYMEKYKDAIARSREVADDASVMAGASDNAYTGILKGVIKPNQNAFARSMNIFNNYMTRFVTYEYLASRTAINALVGNGTISPMRGAAILAGVTSRMMVYTMLTKVLGGTMTSLVLGALGFEYDDEDEEKTALQLAGQSIGSALTSLLVGRDFGNVARNILNYGVEYVNANYLEDLRTGEYDPYKDSMQMSIIPQDPSKMKAEKMIQSVAGPLAPAIGTGIFVIKKIAEEPKKEKEAIERSDIETNVMIPLKIAGTLGLVPLYKDINKAVNDYTYQSLRDDDKGSSEPPMSKELMKKYYPDLYNKMYKSNPAKEQQEKRIKDRKEMIKKRKEDAIKSKLRR
jgi:hypothetical protein